MTTYVPADHPRGGPRPPAGEGEPFELVDRADAQRIQDAIDRATADFKKLDGNTRGLRRP